MTEGAHKDEEQYNSLEEKNSIQIEYKVSRVKFVFVDITVVASILQFFYEAVGKKSKKQKVDELLALHDWYELYCDGTTGKRVLCEAESLEHKHELHTAKLLTHCGYDVLFAPKGLFARHEKRFDVFLIKDYVLLKADMKSITSKNPDTIANRIKGGSDQASRVVVDICSDVEKKYLIEGLRSGVENNKLIKEVFLFYNKKFYQLPKDLIKSKRIFSVIK